LPSVESRACADIRLAFPLAFPHGHLFLVIFPHGCSFRLPHGYPFFELARPKAVTMRKRSSARSLSSSSSLQFTARLLVSVNGVPHGRSSSFVFRTVTRSRETHRTVTRFRGRASARSRLLVFSFRTVTCFGERVSARLLVLGD
jgi:hypothetical protein